MLYRRRPYIHRQYLHLNNDLKADDNIAANNNIDLNALKEIREIPLPNEEEKAPVSIDRKLNSHKSSLMNFFKKRMEIEDLLLLGLIFLLISEGIEDDLLIIIFLFILLTGKE